MIKIYVKNNNEKEIHMVLVQKSRLSGELSGKF